MNNFEVVIGIEIHLELNTKTKMFSSTPIVDADPNTLVSEIDLGYPGTLPTINEAAVIRAVKLAKSLNMKIDNILHFDRKNYYYFDLPKGYQITQFFRPIGLNGTLKINDKDSINVERIHLEEDTAKSTHLNNFTLLDYNRSGIPLIEIVTDPDFRDENGVVDYLETIRQLALTLDISDAKMEFGSMRVDVNISVRPFGNEEMGTKVEIKNLNSISNIKKAIREEINIQTKDILMGNSILQCTKRFDEKTQKPIIMRMKDDSVDYRYFPDPNIPPIIISSEILDNVKLPELPWDRKTRYIKEGLKSEYINKLMSNLIRANYFDSIEYKDRLLVSKIFFSDIVSLANNLNLEVNDLKIDSKELTKAFELLESGIISGSHLKKIIPLLNEGNLTTTEIIEKHNMKQMSNKDELYNIINNIIDNNNSFIQKNIDRIERVEKFLVGQVMKETKGQANPNMASEIIKEKMKKNV